MYTEKLCIATYVFLIMIILKNTNLEIESRENLGAMVIIPNGLEIFRCHNTKDSKNYMNLQYRL